MKFAFSNWKLRLPMMSAHRETKGLLTNAVVKSSITATTAAQERKAMDQTPSSDQPARTPNQTPSLPSRSFGQVRGFDGFRGVIVLLFLLRTSMYFYRFPRSSLSLERPFLSTLFSF